jgi:hypothetical protein
LARLQPSQCGLGQATEFAQLALGEALIPSQASDLQSQLGQIRQGHGHGCSSKAVQQTTNSALFAIKCSGEPKGMALLFCYFDSKYSIESSITVDAESFEDLLK